MGGYTLRNVNAYLQCLSHAEALQVWWDKLAQCGYFQSVPTEMVAVPEALNRVSARCIYAAHSVPHYNGAAMDGIAVQAQDTFGATETVPRKFKILAPNSPTLLQSCYIVDTGDLLPQGTNAVIMVEDVHHQDGFVEIIAAAAPWQHVRIIGEDIAAGEMVLPEHHVIAPADIAALMATGLTAIEVICRPRVAVIPTGTELVASWAELKPGNILDVNSHMLSAAIAGWGGLSERHSIVTDDYPALRQAVASSLSSHDMVVTNAGTSAGTEDFTSRIFAELGEVLVHGVAIKPGKPVILAICQGKPVIGLPGYPVSAMLTAELFLRDILFARQKRSLPAPRHLSAVVARQVYSQVGVEEHIRVSLGTVQGRNVAVPLGRGAGLISTLTKTQGIIRIPQEVAGLTAGATVNVTLLTDEPVGNTLLAVGSHDLALDILAMFLRRRFGLTLSCANVGSMGGIMAIRNNEAHIAGVHILDTDSGEYNTTSTNKYLPDGTWRLVHLAMREQGLIVGSGNPKNIHTLQDLARPGIEFVNRQRGSGTRMLLDYQLKKLGLNAMNISGYDKEVGTHVAVSSMVADGVADVGLGIQAAAKAFQLEFIPVAQEQYDLLLNFLADDQRLSQVMDILQSADFRREVEVLGGYDLSNAGLTVTAR